MIAIEKKKKKHQKWCVCATQGEVYAETIEDLKGFLGVSDSAYGNWRGYGCPGKRDFDFQGEQRSGYPIGSIFRWRLSRENDRSEVEEESKSLQERLSVAEVRKAEADADFREAKTAQLRGELVTRSSVKAKLFEIITENRILIEQIPKKIASSFPPETRADNTADVEHMIRLILKNMANKQNGIISDSD